MKRLFIILMTMVVLLSGTPAFALEVNPTSAPEDENESGIKKKITDLKERLATRVAELKSQNKRAFAGVIKGKDDTSITLSYKETELKVLYDENTKISSKNARGKKTDAKKDVLVVGQNVVAFGMMDVDQKALLSKSLMLFEQPVVVVGTVTEVNSKAGTFSIDSVDGKNVLDYEIGTKCNIYSKEKLETCGLSKIAENDRVLVRMIQNEGDITKATALRILVLPSGEPTTKVSPTPTVKATPTKKATVTPTKE